MTTQQSPELAFYYPNPMWHRGDWVKNILLFFDGIALLVPEYMRERPDFLDPAITAGLREHGLLTVIEPETFVDKGATEALAMSMTNIIVSGALDKLAKEQTEFRELSYSRLGYMGDSGLAEMIYQELKERGLAKESKDGVSIPMHPMVRSLVLVLLAQILRANGRAHGLELIPATDLPQVQAALTQMLQLETLPSTGHVVSFDMQAIGLDLSAVPLEEILQFREEQGEEYRRYRRNIERFIREIAELPSERQASALEERQQEIREAAERLKQSGKRQWRRQVGFAFSLVGAAWRLYRGDIFGATLAFGAAAVPTDMFSSQEVGAYSFLFNARQRLS